MGKNYRFEQIEHLCGASLGRDARWAVKRRKNELQSCTVRDLVAQAHFNRASHTRKTRLCAEPKRSTAVCTGQLSAVGISLASLKWTAHVKQRKITKLSKPYCSHHEQQTAVRCG